MYSTTSYYKFVLSVWALFLIRHLLSHLVIYPGHSFTSLEIVLWPIFFHIALNSFIFLFQKIGKAMGRASRLQEFHKLFIKVKHCNLWNFLCWDAAQFIVSKVFLYILVINLPQALQNFGSFVETLVAPSPWNGGYYKKSKATIKKGSSNAQHAGTLGKLYCFTKLWSSPQFLLLKN